MWRYQEVLEEADFFGLEELRDLITSRLGEIANQENEREIRQRTQAEKPLNVTMVMPPSSHHPDNNQGGHHHHPHQQAPVPNGGAPPATPFAENRNALNLQAHTGHQAQSTPAMGNRGAIPTPHTAMGHGHGGSQVPTPQGGMHHPGGMSMTISPNLNFTLEADF